jgi:hypothetical protein
LLRHANRQGSVDAADFDLFKRLDDDGAAELVALVRGGNGENAGAST